MRAGALPVYCRPRPERIPPRRQRGRLSSSQAAIMGAAHRIVSFLPVRIDADEDAMAIDIDLNCDMGESYGRWTLGADEEIMPFISSASIACGFHGGDPHVMRKTVALARTHGV